MFIDTHAHLNDEQFQEDLKEVLSRAAAARVRYVVNVGYDLASSRKAAALAEEYPELYAVVGIHPDEAKEVTLETYQELRKLAGQKKVVAIGEIGLDYYWDNSPRDVQQEVFRQQIRLAQELDLPIVIHDREAHGDILKIMQEEKPKRGIMHCYSGSREMAEICLQLGFYISFAGPLTFKNAKKAVEVAETIPLDRLLIETDCPYLTPHPFRGKRNEPARVVLVGEKLAQIKGLTVEEIAEVTSSNARRIFSFPE